MSARSGSIFVANFDDLEGRDELESYDEPLEAVGDGVGWGEVLTSSRVPVARSFSRSPDHMPEMPNYDSSIADYFLDEVQERGKDQEIPMLPSARSQDAEAIFETVRRNAKPGTLKYILNHPSTCRDAINTGDVDGHTPLYRAAVDLEDPEMVGILLRHGADADFDIDPYKINSWISEHAAEIEIHRLCTYVNKPSKQQMLEDGTLTELFLLSSKFDEKGDRKQDAASAATSSAGSGVNNAGTNAAPVTFSARATASATATLSGSATASSTTASSARATASAAEQSSATQRSAATQAATSQASTSTVTEVPIVAGNPRVPTVSLAGNGRPGSAR